MSTPNILFITTDQQALHAVGCYGAAVCRTPNIDALAADGVRFERAYTACGLCAPMRASLLSGLYPHRHGVVANCEVDRPDLAIYPDRLGEAGYRLGYSGKWHAGIRRTAGDAGFEGYGPRGYGTPRRDPEYAAYLDRRGLTMPAEVIEFYAEGEPKYARGDSSGYTDGATEATQTAFVAETAMGLIDRFAAADEPFFVHCSFWGPHAPYLPSRDFMDRYEPGEITPWESFGDDLAGRPLIHRKHRTSVFPAAAEADWTTWARMIARYYAYASEIDAHVGRIVARLKELGLYEQTLVVFAADHGETIGIHGGAFDKGAMPYEEVYRVPLIVKLPGGAGAGTTRTQRVSLLDLPATFCEAAGTAMAPTDGVSLLPILDDPDRPGREHLVAEFHRHRFPASQRIIWWEHYKYVLNFADTDELYDLAADPAELRNRIDQPSLRDVRDEMRRRLLDHMLATEDTHGPQWRYILERPCQR